MIVLRAALIAFGLLACAWFALAVRAAHNIGVAHALVAPPTRISLRTAQAEEAALGRAGFLNPDLSVQLLRAEVQLHVGRAARAAATAWSATRREPENSLAWTVYGYASAGIDPAATRHAQAEIRRLIPPVQR